MWERRGLSDSLIKDNVRLQRRALQAPIVTGRSCSLSVLLPPAWDRRRPWCQPQTSSPHAQSALDDTNSSEQQGGVHAGRHHPSTGATSPATKHFSCWSGGEKKEKDSCRWPSHLTLMSFKHRRSIQIHARFNYCVLIALSCDLVCSLSQVRTLLVLVDVSSQCTCVVSAATLS